MSDEGNRPKWPGQRGDDSEGSEPGERPSWPKPRREPLRPSWRVPQAQEPEAPAPEPGAVEPSAPTPPVVAPPPTTDRSFWRRSIELKLVIAVLIGLVSVTGALLTWRSALFGEFATDKDRQAIQETVRQQQDEARIQITLQDERTRFVEYASALTAAAALEGESAARAEAGDEVDAQRAADEAEELRRVADSLTFTGTSAISFFSFTTEDPETGAITLDDEALLDDLRSEAEAFNPVDPGQTKAEAVRLRNKSQRLVGWIIPLVSAVVLLTIAQISRRRELRLAFAGAATTVWLASSAIAFGGI